METMIMVGYALIIIGGGLLVATLSKKNTSKYIKSMKLPQTPDIEWYKNNLLEIVNQLKEAGRSDLI